MEKGRDYWSRHIDAWRRSGSNGLVCISSCTSSTSPLICLRMSVAPGRTKIRASPNSRWIIDCSPARPAPRATAPRARVAIAALIEQAIEMLFRSRAGAAK